MLHSIPFDIVFHLITLQTHPSRHSDKSGDKFVTGFVTEIKTSAYPLTSAQLVSVLIAYATDSLSTSFQSNLVHYTMFTGWYEGEITRDKFVTARDKFVTLFVTWQTCPVSGFDRPKCISMITNSQTHDSGAVGAQEPVFWEIRFSNLARMVRVTRTHPLKDSWFCFWKIQGRSSPSSDNIFCQDLF